MSTKKVIKSVCGFCGAGCKVLITVRDGQAVDIKADTESPLNKGILCKRGRAALEYLYNPHRLKYPLKRVGEKGEGKWEQISWEEAFNITAEKLNTVKEKYGPEYVFMEHGYAKAFKDTHLVRLANAFGTPNVVNPDYVCHVPRMLASEFTFGFFPGADLKNSPSCIILWGANKYRTGIMGIHGLKEAQHKGAKIITIDPLKTQHAKDAKLWLQIKPGTDLALSLGMMNVIINEELYDKDFVDKWTIGFKQLKEHVQEYTPEKVSKITWIPKEKIVEAARMYANSKSSVILLGNAIDHNNDSFEKARSIYILMAITGNLDIPGGQIEVSPTGYRYNDRTISAQNGVKGRWSYELELRDMLTIDKRKNKLGSEWTAIPDFRSTTGQAVVKSILEGIPYEIKAGYIQASNPLSSWANTNETYEAFKKLEFLAVSDLFMTPTVMMADIIFPAATYLEFEGIGMSAIEGTAIFHPKVVQVGECRSDHEIINGLAKALGLEEYFWKDIYEFWDNVLEPTGLTFNELKEQRVLLPKASQKEYRKYEKKGFKTQSGKVELYSEQIKQWGLDPIPTYNEKNELVCVDSEANSEYPFICTCYKEAVYMHSAGKQIDSLRNSKIDPIMYINSKTAKKLELIDGDWAYVETNKGRIKQKVRLDENIDKRVVVLENAWWFPEKGYEKSFGINESNYNVLTNNEGEFGKATGSFNIRGLACKVYKAF